ncbi:hypothetical protein [Nannocystis pusilla]|uniref:Uncharacterized protein n=1 Tax=Nannocystis pusilla TaxID=889268 RepID=A0ABS7TUP7_9BACT|nr:hypothetical protein [Nannocystis pusilla]MBZ5711881.1 hypothetical protein [Nannocystis pusilla]
MFPNHHAVVETLPIPTQEAIESDGVSFCWCPIDDAVREAGPLTRRVLEAMNAHVGGGKRHVYIDSKIQYFARGDVPVDSQHWHVDGSIVARDERARRLGHALLHDMRARLQAPAAGPRYLAYQSSGHCATLFAAAPVTLTLPELIPNFDELDRRVRALAPPAMAQPPASIVRFDGLSLHRAGRARALPEGPLRPARTGVRHRRPRPGRSADRPLSVCAQRRVLLHRPAVTAIVTSMRCYERHVYSSMIISTYLLQHVPSFMSNRTADGLTAPGQDRLRRGRLSSAHAV